MGVSVFGWYCNLFSISPPRTTRWTSNRNHQEPPGTTTTRNRPTTRTASRGQCWLSAFWCFASGVKTGQWFHIGAHVCIFFIWAYNVQANLYWQGHATLMPWVRYILLHLGVQQIPKELGPYMVGGVSSQHRRLECTFDSVRSMYLLRCA